MKSLQNKYEDLKQQVDKLLTEDNAKGKVVRCFKEFEKLLIKTNSGIKIDGHKKDILETIPESNFSSDVVFNILEKFVREAKDFSPNKILLRGLEVASKLTKSQFGFLHFVNNTNEPMVWPTKYVIEQSVSFRSILDVFSKTVINSGLSLIKNDINEIMVLSDETKLTINKYIIVPIYQSNEVAAILFLANKTKDYCEKDASQLMFIGINIWMMAERKRTEDALKHSENKFKLLTQHISDFLWSCDLKCNLTYMNPPAAAALGYNQSELDNLNLNTLLTHEGKDLFSKKLKERLALEKKGVKTESAGHIIEHVRKDGSLFWAEINLSPLRDESGKIIGMAGVTRDVTQRLIDEKKLISSEKSLREAVAAKDKFLSIIAHDLKSPFSALVGLSEVLLERHSKMNPDSREEIIRSIYQSTLRTYNLLENLLDWSGMQTGRKAYKPEAIDLAYLATDIADLFAELIKRKNIEFIISGERNIKAFADTDMINTVFRNLLSNSLKYTPNGGKISIHITNHSHTFLKITFSDTGLGIEPNDLDKLFRIDSNVSKPGIDNEKGTGLGLVLCKEFIEKNGGTISVKSTLNKGTSFTFTLKKDTSNNQ